MSQLTQFTEQSKSKYPQITNWFQYLPSHLFILSNLLLYLWHALDRAYCNHIFKCIHKYSSLTGMQSRSRKKSVKYFFEKHFAKFWDIYIVQINFLQLLLIYVYIYIHNIYVSALYEKKSIFLMPFIFFKRFRLLTNSGD